jgi:ADP-dependent NAD(P)H-hydrate dehydratase
VSPTCKPGRADVRPLDVAALAAVGAPRDAGTSKHERGRVLLIGGSGETAGAMLLAGEAALRVGAGVPQVATAASAVPSLSTALPEARFIRLAERGPHRAVVDADGVLPPLVARADAVLLGPGCLDVESCAGLLTEVVAALDGETALVLDAASLDCVAADPNIVASVAERTALMPNVAEAARFLDVSIEDVANDVGAAATAIAQKTATTVAVRGEATAITGRDGCVYIDGSGHPLLGTAGSGDVLAGALAGLAARGEPPLAAVVWAVHSHARAGEMLAREGQASGRLARELLPRLPIALARLEAEVAAGAGVPGRSS